MPETTVEVSVVNAAIARLAGDATLTAIYASTVIDQLFGPLRNISVDEARYIVLTPDTNDNPKHAQRSDGFEVTFAVMVVDLASNGVHNIGPAAERIYGDANKTIANAGVPTYGLHMHKLSLGSDANGWVANTVMSVGAFYDKQEDILVRVEKFKVPVSRVPA